MTREALPPAPLRLPSARASSGPEARPLRSMPGRGRPTAGRNRARGAGRGCGCGCRRANQGSSGPSHPLQRRRRRRPGAPSWRGVPGTWAAPRYHYRCGHALCPPGGPRAGRPTAAMAPDPPPVPPCTQPGAARCHRDGDEKLAGEACREGRMRGGRHGRRQSGRCRLPAPAAEGALQQGPSLLLLARSRAPPARRRGARGRGTLPAHRRPKRCRPMPCRRQAVGWLGCAVRARTHGGLAHVACRRRCPMHATCVTCSRHPGGEAKGPPW